MLAVSLASSLARALARAIGSGQRMVGRPPASHLRQEEHTDDANRPVRAAIPLSRRRRAMRLRLAVTAATLIAGGALVSSAAATDVAHWQDCGSVTGLPVLAHHVTCGYAKLVAEGGFRSRWTTRVGAFRCKRQRNAENVVWIYTCTRDDGLQGVFFDQRLRATPVPRITQLPKVTKQAARHYSIVALRRRFKSGFYLGGFASLCTHRISRTRVRCSVAGSKGTPYSTAIRKSGTPGTASRSSGTTRITLRQSTPTAIRCSIGPCRTAAMTTTSASEQRGQRFRVPSLGCRLLIGGNRCETTRRRRSAAREWIVGVGLSAVLATGTAAAVAPGSAQAAARYCGPRFILQEPLGVGASDFYVTNVSCNSARRLLTVGSTGPAATVPRLVALHTRLHDPCEQGK